MRIQGLSECSTEEVVFMRYSAMAWSRGCNAAAIDGAVRARSYTADAKSSISLLKLRSDIRE